MKEKEELDAQEEYKKKLAFLTAAYVEYLDDDYLFHQMFEDDKGLLFYLYIYNYLISLHIRIYI